MLLVTFIVYLVLYTRLSPPKRQHFSPSSPVEGKVTDEPAAENAQVKENLKDLESEHSVRFHVEGLEVAKQDSDVAGEELTNL